MSTLSLDPTLIHGLRESFLQGATLPELVNFLHNGAGQREVNPLMVMNYFMRAFDLRFLQVRHLVGAPCMGGKAYTDQHVEDMLRQHIDLEHVKRLRRVSRLAQATRVSPRSGLNIQWGQAT